MSLRVDFAEIGRTPISFQERTYFSPAAEILLLKRYGL